MRLWDISRPLRDGSTSWPGEGRSLHQRWISSRAHGDRANTTAFEGSVHLGTHIDAPMHFIDQGADVADLDLDRCVGSATVVEIAACKQIGRSQLGQMRLRPLPRRLLLKTRNSAPTGAAEVSRFDEDFCAVTADAAKLMVERGVQLIGIDAASIAPYRDPVPTHEILLGAGVIVLEGLDLRNVEPGDYTLIALPLRLSGFEGSPVRAVLLRES